MGISNIFKAFQPKDKVFFALFDQVTQALVDMSGDFLAALKDFDINDDAMLRKMSKYEHTLDELTHEIYVQLGKNFITPFDREDINLLAGGLDDIADYIYASSKYIFLYKSPEVKAYEEFALLINKSCIELRIAIQNLNGFKNIDAIKESCIKINSFENLADDVLTRSLERLFSSNVSPVDIIKEKDVLNYLEIVTDKAEDVANTIENIVIKYA